jgi:hypothetical protein
MCTSIHEGLEFINYFWLLLCDNLLTFIDWLISILSPFSSYASSIYDSLRRNHPHSSIQHFYHDVCVVEMTCEMHSARHASRIHYFRKVELGSLKTIGFTCGLARLLAFGSGPRGCNLNLEGAQLRLLNSLLGTAVSPFHIRKLGLLSNIQLFWNELKGFDFRGMNCHSMRKMTNSCLVCGAFSLFYLFCVFLSSCSLRRVHFGTLGEAAFESCYLVEFKS